MQEVAIYVRVSTNEQEVSNQLEQLKQWTLRMGYEIYGEYIDYESGSKGKGERAEFGRLFLDASKRKFDLVLFWALDRFTREGLQKTIYYLQQLDSYGVKVHSYTEPYLNTNDELVRDILLSVLASLAKQERRRISERTKAGLEIARKNGKRLGAKPKDYLVKDIRRLATEEDLNKSQIARELKVARKTVLKYYPVGL